MKHSILIGAAVTLGIASCAGAAQLTLALGPAGSSHNPDGAGGVGNVRGGMFEVTINSVAGLAANKLGGDIAVGVSFYTFCVEVTETVNPTSTYSFDVNTASIHGGASPLNPQPLASQTAYLYTQFRAGTLNSLVAGGFSMASNNDVNALQDALWYFQNQLGVQDMLDNVYSSMSTKARAMIDLANAALLESSWVGIGNVRILNLGPNANNQDQLALIPLPGGAGLAAAGLMAIGVRRRRAH
jgi:hypothetical protein